MINEGNVKKGGLGKPPLPPRPPSPPHPRLYNGAGVRVDRPPTVEWPDKRCQPMSMQPMSVFSFFAFMFCFFCLGVAFGGYVCGN